MGQTTPIPKGHHTVTPILVLRDCAAAIEFYQRALGARELMRMPSPDGRRIWHAELQIGDSIVYLGDEVPGWPTRAPSAREPAAMAIQLYVPDCDAVFARAIESGAKPTRPLEDMFWGDRMGSVTDPFGYQWTIGTHVRDVSQRELEGAMEALRHPEGGEDLKVASFRRAEQEERDAWSEEA
jgi:PhnB protein